MELVSIALKELHESPLNPRKDFEPGALRELAHNLVAEGQITPCIVRPRPQGGYELAAGHRRYRAAKLGNLPTLYCVVREMDDRTFLEVLTIENLQREDLHPLEEARGFRSLMDEIGYDIPRIADRCSRSVQYVYDRIKLLQLTKPAQALFLEGRFSASHAILLARLSATEQAKAIGENDGAWGKISGLFQGEYAGARGRKELPGESTKAVSVAEFREYIDQHVRFKAAEVDLPQLFPETDEKLRYATEQELTVVHITYRHVLPPELKDRKEKTYGPLSWKRADGKPDPRRYGDEGRKASKPCDHAVMGIIAIGDGRGEAFRVCVAKEKCQVHWPKSKAKTRAKTRASSAGQEERWAAYERAQQERSRREQQERDARAARYKKAMPAIAKAVTGAVSALPDKLLIPMLFRLVNASGSAPNLKAAVQGIIAGDLLRDAEDSYRQDQFAKACKAKLGVDIAKILNQAAPIERPAAAKKAAKKAKK